MTSTQYTISELLLHRVSTRLAWSAAITFAVITLCVSAGLALTPTPTVIVTIDLKKSAARPGGIACVAAQLAAVNATVAGTSNDIGFDPNQFLISSCAINPAIGPGSIPNKDAFSSTPSSGVERVGVFSLSNVNPIPNGTLFTCTLVVGAGTAPGTYALNNAPAAFDPTGEPIPGVGGAPGQLVITNCPGDCDGDNNVTVGEVIKCVNLFLGLPLCNLTNPALSCPVAHAGLLGGVSIGEVTQCVNRFLGGCPPLSPSGTPTRTPTATPTATRTPTLANVPIIAIGSASGAPQTQVTVPLSLTKNGPDIVVIAPLRFDFDPAVLTFNSCISKVAGKNADASSPSSGRVSVVLSGGLSTIPDGNIIDCLFTIKVAAPSGMSPLIFVLAGLSDDQLNDYTGVGTNGAVTVSGTGTAPPAPSATPTLILSP